MVFERLLSADIPESEVETETEKKPEQLPDKENISLFGQWKNLLDYDGTRQEESDYENR